MAVQECAGAVEGFPRSSSPSSFRDGPMGQTRNLDVKETQANLEIPGSMLRIAPE
jgi:hypothetical protein